MVDTMSAALIEELDAALQLIDPSYAVFSMEVSLEAGSTQVTFDSLMNSADAASAAATLSGLEELVTAAMAEAGLTYVPGSLTACALASCYSASTDAGGGGLGAGAIA